MDVEGDYCRAVEAYLCRKNDGHLIRIVGPSFERVCGWEALGIPLRVVESGIDRYFERYYAKGPRRRPVHIDFCEADVLDAFDEWRRAVGLRGTATTTHDASDPDEHSGSRRETLPVHVDRVIARLTALRGGADRSLDATLDEVIRELDAGRAGARGLRGEAREAFLTRLGALDTLLLNTGRGLLDDRALQELRREAERELAPFKGRLPGEAYERSLAGAVDRLVRERLRLPVLILE